MTSWEFLQMFNYFIFERRNCNSSSLLWEIKYWFCFLLRLARISWIWSYQKPVREYITVNHFFSFIEFCIMFFRDEDIGKRCEGQCELEYVDCTLSCSDTNCLIDCGRTLTDCINGLNISEYFNYRIAIFLYIFRIF